MATLRSMSTQARPEPVQAQDLAGVRAARRSRPEKEVSSAVEARDTLTQRLLDAELKRTFQHEAGAQPRRQVSGTIFAGAATWLIGGVLLDLLFPGQAVPIVVTIAFVQVAFLAIYVAMRQGRTWDALQTGSASVNVVGGFAIVVLGTLIVPAQPLLPAAHMVGFLWGDTVNVASRMESQGVEGAVMVAPATAAALGAAYPLKPRDPVEVRGKVLMETFLVEAPEAQAEVLEPAA